MNNTILAEATVTLACILLALYSQWRRMAPAALWLYGPILTLWLVLAYLFFGESRDVSPFLTWPWGSSFGLDTAQKLSLAWLRLFGLMVISITVISELGFLGLIRITDNKWGPRPLLIPVEVMVIYFFRLGRDLADVKEAYSASGQISPEGLGLKDHVLIATTFVISSLLSIRSVAVGYFSRGLQFPRKADIYLLRVDPIASAAYALVATTSFVLTLRQITN